MKFKRPHLERVAPDDIYHLCFPNNVSELGRDEGHTVKYNPFPEEILEARKNS